MKQFPLVQVGEKNFRIACTDYSLQEIISPNVIALVSRMKYTMRKVSGVGLAAPQIGVPKNVFVLRLRPTKYRPDIPSVRSYAVFNPVIVTTSTQKRVEWEGCFSVAYAKLFAKVTRPATIRVRYINEKGITVTRNLHGLEATVFLHEYDHLRGLVFLERDCDVKTLMSKSAYLAMRKQASSID